jgi:hypothetical protein
VTTKKDPRKNLKPFKPGQSGNPSGRPKMAPDVRKAQQVTSEEFIRVSSEFLLMDRAKIQQRLQNPEASMLELLIGGIVAKAAKDHDHHRAEFLLNRTIGKVADTLNANVQIKSLHMQIVEAMEKNRRVEDE